MRRYFIEIDWGRYPLDKYSVDPRPFFNGYEYDAASPADAFIHSSNLQNEAIVAYTAAGATQQDLLLAPILGSHLHLKDQVA